MNTSGGFFVTGTDTGAGKTCVAQALLCYYRLLGCAVVGMKPIATGGTKIAGKLRNDDALLLQQQSSVAVDYQDTNPYIFAPAIAPHLAGSISLQRIADAFSKLQAQADIVIVEGAGGWQTPINDSEYMADLARVLGLPVVVAVPIRLGCINQARLTLQQIKRDQVPCAGWFAVCLDADMELADENIASINARSNARLLGVLPHSYPPDINLLATKITL